MKSNLKPKVEEEHTLTTYTPPRVEMLKIKVEAGFADSTPTGNVTATFSDKQVEPDSNEDW